MDTELQDCETEVCRMVKPREGSTPTATRLGFCSWCWSDIVKIRAKELNSN